MFLGSVLEKRACQLLPYFSLSLVKVQETLTQHRIVPVSKVVITVNDLINAHIQINASYLVKFKIRID